ESCPEVGGAGSMRLKAEMVFWGTSVSGVAQMDHCFDVKGLGKEVGEGDGLNRVARAEEGAQVTGQGGRIAGDVNQRGRGGLREQGAGLSAQSGAWGIGDDQIGTRTVAVAAKEVEG